MTAAWSFDGVDLVKLDRIAQHLAIALRRGDVITLAGPLGAGKTTFARALIARLGGTDEVQSPTFALAQSYATRRFPVLHCDFYRLQGSELDELGLDDALADGVIVVEWPERAPEWLPDDRLEIRIEETAEPHRRRIELIAHGAWQDRLLRLQALGRFLAPTPYAEAALAYMQGDASARSYARLALPGSSAVLMNSPRAPDGPPIKDGKPYSRLVHLAEDVTPFVAVDLALRERGFSVPAIYAFDLTNGFLVIEDLGDRSFTSEIAAGHDLDELYAAAVDVLAALAEQPPAPSLAIEGNGIYRLPHYDEEAFLIEALLLIDWFWPALHGRPAPEGLREEFISLWRRLLPGASAESGWVLRDYHSPNLMWLPEREGLRKIGILDFQDAVTGPLAYDVVSLLQDARLDLPEWLEAALLDRYCAARTSKDQQFASEQFRSLYATLGAQRNSKILGIFARLAKRDGKRGYLCHIPRVARYLARDLAHPALSSLRAWYEREFPSLDQMPELPL